MPPRERLTLGSLCPRWEGYLPGTRYDCHSPYLGRQVQLRKGEPLSTVIACTSPPWMPPSKRAKLPKRRACEGGFEVSFDGGLGLTTAVRGSKVRERLREREGLCPDALVVDPHSGFVQYEEREAHRARRSPYEGGELPFPHRRGSTPCCKNSPVYPDKVAAMLAELESGDGFLDADDVVAAASKMVPKALRRDVTVLSLEDIPAAVEAVREHCWDIVKRWESSHERAAVYSDARASAAVRKVQQLAEDLGETRAVTVGVGSSSRRVERGWTDRADEKKVRGRKAALSYFRAG